MPNQDVISKYLSSYKKHDYRGMHSALDEEVRFSDFAFDIHGKEVRAMWQLFCSATESRPPVEVPWFEVVDSQADKVVANYRVVYPFIDKTLLGERERKVDYVIEARLWLRNGRIIRHEDVSDIRAWARMAFGYPKCLVAGTAFFHDRVKQEASRRLEDFMRKQPAGGGSA